MEMTVYNPDKGRLITIEIAMDPENTTWFEELPSSEGIASITDVDGSLLIKEASYNYPVLISGRSRSSINYDHRKARVLVNQIQ